MDNQDAQDEMASSFVAMTGASLQEATQYLDANNWDLSLAAQSYYADEDERAAAPANAQAPSDYTGPRTLDGRPAPQAIPTTSTSSSKRPQKKKTGLATLSSLGGGDSGHDHDDDDGDDDYDDDMQHRDTYAGGEKSGLAVQDPNQRSDDPRDVVKKIIKEAEGNARQEPFPQAGPSSSFRSAGQTLGGEGTASRVVPGARAPETVQERTLHIWRDGLSVGDDGPLISYDDPATAQALRDINREEVPPHLFNVRPGERVNLKLVRHDENWRALPKQYVPFGSQGRRLGSVVPGETSTATASTATQPSSTPAASTQSAPTPSVDESQPTVMIRIHMPDGTRLPARFNTTNTINDMYDFVTRASPNLRAGGWVLATTFPPKDFTDKSLTLGDVAEFKRGGTAVVKRT
ncbi:hypothetical protein F5Y16DRAFT_383134 [Xylariaceae sp. FL0255]|nr:hypothetical protein F5Y16DRAFT_383134 [Xylariaceae sp. FL0255]